MEVIYGGNFHDKIFRELIIVERNGKLVARRLRRKITASHQFKDKYPEASVHEYTRNNSLLLKWINAIDWDLASPKSCPMPTLIYKAKRYFFNRSSGQWWDLPMTKHWSSRLSDLMAYEDDRQFKVVLEIDHTHNQVLLKVKQKVVDTPLQPCNICVFRNNDLMYNENFSFIEFNHQYQLVDGTDTLNFARVIASTDDKNPHDIYCILLNGRPSFYDYRGPGGLYSSIPKFLLFAMEEYEKKLGESYKFKDLVFG